MIGGLAYNPKITHRRWNLTPHTPLGRIIEHIMHTIPQTNFNGNIAHAYKNESIHTANEKIIRFSNLDGILKNSSIFASMSSVADPS